jgi:hypothetical protein
VHRDRLVATVTISPDLLGHVRQCLRLSLSSVGSSAGVANSMNAFTRLAFPAYVCAVAAVEAFVNEELIGHVARIVLRDSPLWNLSNDSLEKMELPTKLIVVPQVLFGRSFRRGAQPFQDFALLVKVRNDVIHFKMEMEPPSYLRPLVDRGIALTAEASAAGADYAWPHKLSCTEGIRWAHNTACRVVNGLADFVPPEHRDLVAAGAHNFREIPEAEFREWLAERRAQGAGRKENDDA